MCIPLSLVIHDEIFRQDVHPVHPHKVPLARHPSLKWILFFRNVFFIAVVLFELRLILSIIIFH